MIDQWLPQMAALKLPDSRWRDKHRKQHSYRLTNVNEPKNLKVTKALYALNFPLES